MKKHSEGFLRLVNEAKARIRECSIEDMLARQRDGQDFMLIDCREDREFEAGHIPGAVHIGKGVIERDIEKRYPDRGTALVIYCGGGFRSALAADAATRIGYEDVVSMDGGMRRWRELGYDTEQTA